MLFLSIPTLESLDTLDRNTEPVRTCLYRILRPRRHTRKKTVMESTANHIAFNFIIGRTGLVSDNCDRQFLAIRSHDGILVLRLVVEIKSQLANLCRFAVVLEIDVYRLLVLAFRSVV